MSGAINVTPEVFVSSFSLSGFRMDAMTFHSFAANNLAVARPKRGTASDKDRFLVLIAHKRHTSVN